MFSHGLCGRATRERPQALKQKLSSLWPLLIGVLGTVSQGCAGNLAAFFKTKSRPATVEDDVGLCCGLLMVHARLFELAEAAAATRHVGTGISI